MAIRSTAGYAITAVLSCATGWLMHSAAREPAVPARPSASLAAPAAAPAAAASTALDAGPLIVVASDGNVTLRVEQQPLEWVLEQIAAQSGWEDVKQRARATTTGAPIAAAPKRVVCGDAPIETPEQAQPLLRAIARGSEAERYDALLQARSMGVAVPDETLKSLFETDTSDRVRLLAFDNYVEPLTGSGEALRGVLQAALYVSDGAIQREAQRRLDELLESERTEAAVLQNARW